MSRQDPYSDKANDFFPKMFFYLLGFRLPMPVTQVKVFLECQGEPAYYVCPRCQCTIEREFVHFCDRCGQRLDWRCYKQAEVIYLGMF